MLAESPLFHQPPVGAPAGHHTTPTAVRKKQATTFAHPVWTPLLFFAPAIGSLLPLNFSGHCLGALVAAEIRFV
jgi:hypothetical protein